MQYLLDTSVCVPLLRKKDAILSKKIASKEKSSIFLCSVVKAELWVGAEKSANKTAVMNAVTTFINEFQSFDFDDLSAQHYGTIRAILEKAGTVIGGNDMLIAAIAISNNLILATRNVQEFERVTGLRIEEW